MSDYTFNGDITGDNHQYGDTYNYNSLSDFFGENPNLTKSERKIAKLIFRIEESKESRDKLLEDVKAISEGNQEEIPKSRSTYWDKLTKKLSDKGLDKGIELVYENIIEKVPVFAPYLFDVLNKI